MGRINWLGAPRLSFVPVLPIYLVAPRLAELIVMIHEFVLETLRGLLIFLDLYGMSFFGFLILLEGFLKML